MMNTSSYDDQDDLEGLLRLQALLTRAKEQVERGEYVEWSPTFMDDLTREADELVAQGHEPKRDVCP